MGGGWVVHKTLTRNEQKVEGEEVQAPVEEEEEEINFGGVPNFLPFNFFYESESTFKMQSFGAEKDLVRHFFPKKYFSGVNFKI